MARRERRVGGTMTLDPARVARSLTLDVEPIDGGFRVSGGSEPHTVRATGDGTSTSTPEHVRIAEAYLAELRASDPDAVKRAERFFFLPNP